MDIYLYGVVAEGPGKPYKLFTLRLRSDIVLARLRVIVATRLGIDPNSWLAGELRLLRFDETICEDDERLKQAEEHPEKAFKATLLPDSLQPLGTHIPEVLLQQKQHGLHLLVDMGARAARTSEESTHLRMDTLPPAYSAIASATPPIDDGIPFAVPAGVESVTPAPAPSSLPNYSSPTPPVRQCSMSYLKDSAPADSESAPLQVYTASIHPYTGPASPGTATSVMSPTSASSAGSLVQNGPVYDMGDASNSTLNLESSPHNVGSTAFFVHPHDHMPSSPTSLYSQSTAGHRSANDSVTLENVEASKGMGRHISLSQKEMGNHPSRRRSQATKCRLWTAAAVLLLLAIGLGIGLGVGLTRLRKNDSNEGGMKADPTKPPAQIPVPSPGINQFGTLVGTDFSGNDLSNHTVSKKNITNLNECWQLCRDTPGCIAAVSDRAFQCWAKGNLTNTAILRPDRVVLFPVNDISYLSWPKTEKYDHRGDDIACYNDGSSAALCGAFCVAHPACRAYNFNEPTPTPVNVGWERGGCCVKTSGDGLVPENVVTFWTRP
ncbi:hypothetical protein DFS34DRAFT_693071 [Phlyctochytrium arcticum]|nr:hypothetical protein DFS34DRAFT_693071 [Phlyctochytrium arcticum]